jgi:hypothetical protein
MEEEVDEHVGESKIAHCKSCERLLLKITKQKGKKYERRTKVDDGDVSDPTTTDS